MLNVLSASEKKDDSWLIDQTLETIDLIPKDTVRMGFSGGAHTIWLWTNSPC